MNKEKILESLENGNYEIKYNEDCGCKINWDIDANGELVADVDSDTCYQSYVLTVGGMGIYEYIRYEGWRMLTDMVDIDDIEDDIIDRCRLTEVIEQGESGYSESHDANMLESLVDYLEGCGYELDKDDGRGFANEYTMILRDTGNIVKNSREDCEKWAMDYLYAGDASTQAFVGFSFQKGD